jgi:16S rRNA processing protein RimM
MSRMVLLGEIVRAHGIAGEVKLRSFTASPRDLARYGTLADGKGRSFRLASLREAGEGLLIGRIDGVTDRNAAEALKGVSLYVARDALPEGEDGDDVFAADLVGLRVVDQVGIAIGEIVAVQNFGAGDLLEVKRPGARMTALLPFDSHVVVGIGDGAMIIDASEGSVAAQFLAPVSGKEESAA